MVSKFKSGQNEGFSWDLPGIILLALVCILWSLASTVLYSVCCYFLHGCHMSSREVVAMYTAERIEIMKMSPFGFNYSSYDFSFKDISCHLWIETVCFFPFFPFNWHINKLCLHHCEFNLDKRPKCGNGNMARLHGHFVLPSFCCHNYSHVNEFNWLSRPNANFFALVLRCQAPRGLLLHFKRNKRAGEEHLSWQLSCHMAVFLLRFIPPFNASLKLGLTCHSTQPTVCRQ